MTKVVQVSRAVWHMDRQINLDPNCPSCPGAAMPGLFLSDLSHSPVVLLTRNRHVVYIRPSHKPTTKGRG